MRLFIAKLLTHFWEEPRKAHSLYQSRPTTLRWGSGESAWNNLGLKEEKVSDLTVVILLILDKEKELG